MFSEAERRLQQIEANDLPAARLDQSRLLDNRSNTDHENQMHEVEQRIQALMEEMEALKQQIRRLEMSKNFQ